MADYTVRLVGQDNLSSTIKNVKNAVSDLGSTATTSLDKFSQRFQKIEQSSAPLKRQLRDLRAIMAEMNFKGLSGTDEFTKIAQYAGKVKDAMDDAGAATKRFADDTFALKAAADAMTVVTGAFTAATGAMNLFGVKNEEVKNAILKVQSAMAILNGVQAIANALNKDSALMQALKATKMKISTAVANANTTAIKANTVAEKVSTVTTQQDTVAKNANTVAENVNGVATKRGTVIQNAWNVAKAVAKALVGDFTGLLLVSAGALATYALATANSTDELEDQNEAYRKSIPLIDANTEATKRNEKEQKEWADDVAQGCAKQIAQYNQLINKWKECGDNLQLQKQFIHDNADAFKTLTGRTLDQVSANQLLINQAGDVIEVLKLIAEAAAAQKLYEKAVETKMLNDFNGTVANGRYVAHVREGQKIGTGYATKEAMSAAGLTGGDLNWNLSKLNKQGADKLNAYYKKLAKERRGVDDYGVDYWLKKTDVLQKKLEELKKKLNINPGGGSGSGSGNGNGGSNKSGTTTTKKPEEEVKPLAESLEWMRQELQRLQKELSYGLIPAEKIDETKAKIEVLKDDIEKKEIELGFKVVPVQGSLEDLEEQLSKKKSDLEKGLIPDAEIDATNKQIDDLIDKISAKKIQLGIEVAPETAYEKTEKQRKEFLKGYKDYLRNITSYAKDDDQYKKRLEEIKRYNEERERASENSSDDIPALSEEALQREAKQREELAKLTDQFHKGEITAEQFDEAMEHLGGTLDNVLVTALQPLKKPITFDMGNIPQQYEDAIAEIDKMLNEDDLTVDARIRLNETKQSLIKKVNDIVNGELSIPAKIDVGYIAKGTSEDFRASYENASQMIQQIADDYEKGIIKSSGEAKRQIAEVNKQLTELGLKPIVIEIKTEGQKALENIQMYLSGFAGSITSTVDSFEQLARSIDEGASGWEIFKNILSTTETVLTSISTVMQLVNTLTAAHTAVTTADAAATTADAAASMGAAAAKSAEATATAGVAVAETAAQNSKMGPFGWVMAIAGAVALAATLFSLIGKFENGGIVGGNSYHGDKILARLNSGEAVITRRGTKNLLNAIENGDLGGGATAQTISFKIKGSDLYGTLKNYQKIKGKSGVTTGII